MSHPDTPQARVIVVMRGIDPDEYEVQIVAPREKFGTVVLRYARRKGVDLAAAMIEGSADWPDDGHDIRIECGAAAGIYGDL